MTGSPATSTVHDDAVLAERRGHVLVVTINRPDARNSVNLAVSRGVGAALDLADADPDIRAVVLTGAGSQAFCAGADLKAVGRGESIVPDDEPGRSWGFAGYVGHAVSVPTIAAVNGFALGGGTELALASDLAVADETATFGLPEVKRGIVAGAGGAFRLVQQLPHKLAMELLLTGEPITAARALDLGLVNAVAPAGTVLEAAIELAERIAVNAPLAVQTSKRIARGIVDGTAPDDDRFWALSMRESGRLMRSEDAREGVRAFAERRAPQWTAR